MKQAYFAGGCFWCVEHDMRALSGVRGVKSGYASEHNENIITPTYSNHKGFREAVFCEYDSEKISYKKLCQFFIINLLSPVFQVFAGIKTFRGPLSTPAQTSRPLMKTSL